MIHIFPFVLGTHNIPSRLKRKDHINPFIFQKRFIPFPSNRPVLTKRLQSIVWGEGEMAMSTSKVQKWEDLNEDCLVKIFEKAGLKALIHNLPLVCKSWYRASLEPQCWKVLDFQFIEFGERSRTIVRLCHIALLMMSAVDRSRGMATKVLFPSGWFLEVTIEYVLKRCSSLKSLTLPYDPCFVMSNLLELIKQWKDLEFISLSTACDFKNTLTEIHTHCKNFFALEAGDCIDHEEASTIVTLVPNIKHLVLRNCNLLRENLILILSGCRELELLDVSGCQGFDADDVEILRMASHIKTFISKGAKAFKR